MKSDEVTKGDEEAAKGEDDATTRGEELEVEGGLWCGERVDAVTWGNLEWWLWWPAKAEGDELRNVAGLNCGT